MSIYAFANVTNQNVFSGKALQVITGTLSVQRCAHMNFGVQLSTVTKALPRLPNTS